MVLKCARLSRKKLADKIQKIQKEVYETTGGKVDSQGRDAGTRAYAMLEEILEELGY